MVLHECHGSDLPTEFAVRVERVLSISCERQGIPAVDWQIGILLFGIVRSHIQARSGVTDEEYRDKGRGKSLVVLSHSGNKVVVRGVRLRDWCILSAGLDSGFAQECGGVITQPGRLDRQATDDHYLGLASLNQFEERSSVTLVFEIVEFRLGADIPVFVQHDRHDGIPEIAFAVGES